jgi:protein SCO1
MDSTAAADTPSTRPARPLAERLNDRVAALVGSPRFWILFVLIGVGFPMARAMRQQLPPPLPVLGKVPAFMLIDQNSQPFGSPQLEGRVWLANFIFTRCPTICPVFTGKMAKVQHRARNLGESFHLVSFTVDPEHDTAAVLQDYARRNKVSPRMWSFLTGPREDIKKTVVDGLKVHMTKDGPDDDLMSIGHGSHFVLVDAQMQIRGYYDSANEESVNNLLRDAGLLANRGE